MAGTIVNAVYLDLRLDLKGVEKGLKNLSSSFDGLGGQLSNMVDSIGLDPLTHGFANLSGQVAGATRHFVENANVQERVRAGFDRLVAGASSVSGSVAEMGRGLANVGFDVVGAGANRLTSGLNQLLGGARRFGADFRTAFAGARRESDGLGATFGRTVAGIGNGWQQMTQGLAPQWEGAWFAIGRTFTGMVNRIISGFNTMISGINRISVDIPAWLGGGSLGFNLPKMPSVPALATGGIVTAPTLALVGEAGREAVLPLENNTGWMVTLTNMLVDAVSVLGAGGAVASPQPTRVEVTLDGKKLAEALVGDLEEVQARRGRG